MNRKRLFIGTVAGMLCVSGAQAGLVQLEFNHTALHFNQGNYWSVLKDLTHTQTNDYVYPQDFGYNDFRFDIRFSDFSFKADEDTGKLFIDDQMSIDTTFSVDFDDAQHQADFYDLATEAQFYGQPAQFMLNEKLPDGFAGALMGFYDRDIQMNSASDKDMSDVESLTSQGHHLTMGIHSDIHYGSNFDVYYMLGTFGQTLIDGVLTDTYEGTDPGLSNPSQSDIDQYVSDNFISAMNWSLSFTRAPDIGNPDDLSYFLDTEISLEYAPSAQSNVETLFDSSFNRLLAVMEHMHGVFGLDTTTTNYAFVTPPDEATSVPEPNALWLIAGGLFALVWCRKRLPKAYSQLA